MNSYHDIRSVRSWINSMYPNVPILVQRNAQHDKKSYFFLQDAREKHEDTGRGLTSMLRTINVHLVTEGLTPANPNADEAYWKTKRVLDYMQARLLQERVIPQFLYNEPWFPPIAWKKPGGAMTAGTHTLAVTSIDAYNKESLLSSPVTVTVANGDHLYLTITNWPLGRPMAKEYVIYRRTSTSPDVYQAIKVIPITFAEWMSTSSELTSLAPLAGPRVPPATSKQWMGWLKIDTATTNMVESISVDDAFHGFLNVTFRSRRPQTWKPAPPLTRATTTMVPH